MLNHLLIGLADKTERLLKLAQPPFLIFDDGPVCDAFIDAFPRAKQFDISQHSFDPLRDIDHTRAEHIAAIPYSFDPESGKTTLTVRDGRRALVRMLGGRLDQLPHIDHKGAQEALDTVDDLLLSPVLRSVLCGTPNFRFETRRGNLYSVIVKLDRAAIGDKAAFMLASFLVQQFKGQVIVPDFGFYGRDFYSAHVRQERLIAGVQLLSELSLPLQQTVLSIKDKTVYRTTMEDAKRLMFYINPVGNPSVLVNQDDGEYKTS